MRPLGHLEKGDSDGCYDGGIVRGEDRIRPDREHATDLRELRELFADASQ